MEVTKSNLGKRKIAEPSKYSESIWIPKGGVIKINQFRCISLLNTERKIFFSILNTKLMEFWQKNNYIDTSVQKRRSPRYMSMYGADRNYLEVIKRNIIPHRQPLEFNNFVFGKKNFPSNFLWFQQIKPTNSLHFFFLKLPYLTTYKAHLFLLKISFKFPCILFAICWFKIHNHQPKLYS